ncbi:MAG: hypothetical protein MK132_10365 [Lentisphaerales bacterium]|nr:hypothetical protein [Lentisphaerales bacterium]
MRKFTLVELIIVVAVLSVLISLLLSSIRKAKDAALQDVCLANVNQLQVTYMRFTLKNDYTFPYNRKEVIGGNTLSDFQKHSKISLYLNNNYEVFKCPADPMSHTGTTFRHAIKSYAFSAYLHEILSWSITKFHQVEDSHNNVMGFVEETGSVNNGFVTNAADWVGA